jgi:Na+/H+ antiporter NhaC
MYRLSLLDLSLEINDEYDLNPKKTAAILDIFSCIVQGILPEHRFINFKLCQW